MKLLTLLLVLLILPGLVSAQTDSAGVTPLVPMRMIDRHTSSKAYRMLYVSVPVIVGGVVMMSYDKDFRGLRNDHAKSFEHSYDDYLQYAPMGLTYLLKACGVKSRSSWGRMLVSHAFSAALMATAVNSLKYSVRIERPDGSGRNSFPSGHTATAFMAATMLHKEYGHRSPWYSIGGYTVATLVGVTRQLNNRHWVSDVMVGAGIGILTTELGYFLADLIYKNRGLNYTSDGIPLFDRYRHPSFFGLSVATTTVLGRYQPFADKDVSFSAGPTVEVQGAWFMSPYVGFGGRLSVSSVGVKVNNVAQTENFCSASAYAGVYFSYPFSARWLMGAKVLGGYEHYRAYKTDAIDLGRNDGGGFGTGLSMTFIASQNLGVHFTTDYDLAPPMVASTGQSMHRLRFGLGVAAAF